MSNQEASVVSERTETMHNNSQAYQLSLMRDFALPFGIKRFNQQTKFLQLPTVVREKVRALKRLQADTMKIEVDFYQRKYALEREFEPKFNSIYDRRRDIISGVYLPTCEECDFPDPVTAADERRDEEIRFAKLNLTEEANNEIEPTNPTDVPNFWLEIIKYVPLLESMVEEADEPALKHLNDIRATSKPLPDLSFTLEFHFTPNVYFNNSILTKEYLIKCSTDPSDVFEFDGPVIYETIGCDINWKEGNNLTVKTVMRKAQGQDKVEQPCTVRTKTFFDFFAPPKMPNNHNDPLFNEISYLLEADFEIGQYFKEMIIPRAVMYFTGENEDCMPSAGSDQSFSDISDNELGDELFTADGEGDVAPQTSPR